VSGPFAERPLYVNAYGTPKGTPPKISPPKVRVEHRTGIPSVRVLDAGETVLDLACTDALNHAADRGGRGCAGEADRRDAGAAAGRDGVSRAERHDRRAGTLSDQWKPTMIL